MSYLTTQDLLDELGEDTLIQLTDDQGTGGLNETRVLKAIEFAKGTFDSYARTRYSIPVPVTPLVKSINLDLAVFHLYKARTSLKEGIYEVKNDANKHALAMLAKIASGTAALDIPAVEETIDNPTNSDKILSNASKAKFNDTALKSF